MQTLGLHSEAWPAYASVLQLQLLQSQERSSTPIDDPSRYFLRAALNGEALTWLEQHSSAVATDAGMAVPFKEVSGARYTEAMMTYNGK